MTDNDIINDLECCIDGYCRGCAYGDTNQMHCKDDLMQNALDLINRQKAEIKRCRRLLDMDNKTIIAMQKARAEDKEIIDKQRTDIVALKTKYTLDRIATNNVKAEAIKEFAERLKEITSHQYKLGQYVGEFKVDDFNSLLKEWWVMCDDLRILRQG